MFTRYRTSPAGTVRLLWLAAAALWVAAGCGSLPDDTGSIFQVADIQPYYQDAGSITNQVDVVQSWCTTGEDSTDGTPEYYSDHYVSVDFLNRHWPNRLEEHTAGVLTIMYYDLHYTPLDTLTAGYPLPSRLAIPVPQTIAIPACSPGPPGQICPPTTMTGGYFIPLATKDNLRGYLRTAFPGAFSPGYAGPVPQLAYTANYVFYAENEYGKETAPAGASFHFYVSGYDYCN